VSAPRRRGASRVIVPGSPADSRELRAQGRRTMGKLMDAGMRVFAERGYHAARVDDIVHAARASHGTFYLYFASKEDLLRALAVECAGELEALAGSVGPIGPDSNGIDELRRVLEQFTRTYRRYGPVVRAWLEGQVDDREVNRLGVRAFTEIATVLGERLRDSGAPADPATIAALMAMLERFAYFHVSRGLDAEESTTLDTLACVVHRGFFRATAAA